jgi:hypothetical protein
MIANRRALTYCAVANGTAIFWHMQVHLCVFNTTGIVHLQEEADTSATNVTECIIK